MNKKLKNLLAIFIGALCFLLYLNTHNRGNVATSGRVFSIEDTDEVDQVSISSSSGQTIKLMFQGDHWLVKGNKIQKGKSEELVQVLTGLKVRNRVPSIFNDSLFTRINENGITVKCLRGGKIILSYKILVDELNPSEIIVLGEHSKTPFYAHVFGEEINFFSLFSVDVSSWNTLLIADLTKQKIRKVCCDLINDTEDELCITVSDTSLIFEKSEIILDSCDVKKGVEYLRAFKQLKGKKMYSNPKVIKGLISDRKAFFKLRIQTSQDLMLVAYKKAASPNQVDFTGKTIEFDNEYFYLRLNDNLYLMDYFSFEPLMKTEKDFKNE